MKFMLISYASKEWEAGLPPDPKLLAAIPRLYERMPKGGALHSTGGLAPSSAGAKVRVSGGYVVVTDGPFAETKEIVGGFAIVDVGSKEEAIAIAKEFWQLHVDVLGHSFEGGGEIRPMFHQEQCAPPDQPVGEQEAIVEYIRYRIPSDRCAEFEQAYRLAGTPLLASPHCLAFEVTRCSEDPNCYVVRIEWDSTEGHLQGFRGSPEFRTFFRHIQPFVSHIEEMHHYQSVGVQNRK